jgi:hypothetical protein
MVFKSHKAQSFVEFALVIPVLILVLMGVVELTFYIGTYINLVDLTREAARFASVRDPFDLASQASKTSCNDTVNFNFYFDTACIFSQLKDTPGCVYAEFCNGFNSTVPIKSAEDDILISVYTVSGSLLTNQWPSPDGVWVWSNNDQDTAHNDNWRRDCNRLATPGPATPFFTKAEIEQIINNYGATQAKGFVMVEVVSCYHQALNAPVLSQLLPNPIKMHTYTIMPLPAAAPTPTPKP